MKKTIISLLLLILSTTTFAQFKVHSNGYISIGTTTTPLSPISLNCTGNSDYYMAFSGQKRYGNIGVSGKDINTSYVLIPPTDNTMSRVLNVISRPFTAQNSTSLSVGAWCRIEGGPYNYAVLGTINPSTAGAGIVGSASSTIPSVSLLNQSYAGLFYGDVKVTGHVYQSAAVSGLLLNTVPSNDESSTEDLQTKVRESVSSRLSRLALTAYRYKNNSERTEDTNKTIQLDDSTTVVMSAEVDANKIEQQNKSKLHYAIDTELLEELFPELVYEQEDGTKAVNYTEMIPLLVQSIKEMGARLAELEVTTVKDAPLSRGTATALQTTSATSDNVLYQNTPNPFREKTTIRFRLADDAQNAAICIFDLTGKQLKKLPISSGETSVSVNGWELGEGMFLYTLLVNGKEIDTKRMIISK